MRYAPRELADLSLPRTVPRHLFVPTCSLGARSANHGRFPGRPHRMWRSAVPAFLGPDERSTGVSTACERPAG